MSASTRPNPKGRAMSSTTLYERLGGYDAIAAVSNDLVDRLKQTRNSVASGSIAARTA